MYALTKRIKDAFPDRVVISSAPTFLREESPYLAAGAVSQRYADMVGYGRMAFAYPRFAKDTLADAFDKKQTCVTCGKCSVLMRHSRAGCAVRDKVYTELLREMQ
jgi:2,4-dienoyl-CoA reductase-like NADH-dependent reductase (Old Yellow Enzyme family)